MLRSILFGPVSLEKKPENSCTYATLWNVTAVTPGAIAFVAVLVSQVEFDCICLNQCL